MEKLMKYKILHIFIAATLFSIFLSCKNENKKCSPVSGIFPVKIKKKNILEEPSGLSIDISSKSLWTVCDETASIVKMDYCGNIISSFKAKTWQKEIDLEGIHFDKKTKSLLIAVEDNSKNKDENGIIIYNKLGNKIKEHRIMGYGNGKNDGFEAITKIKNYIYVAKEKSNPTIIKLDNNFKKISQRDMSEHLEDISGMAYSGKKEQIFVLSEDSSKVILFDYKSNKILKEISLNKNIKMEGIAFDIKNNQLYLVSDKNKKGMGGMLFRKSIDPF